MALERHVLDHKMPFGKHKGKSLEWIATNDVLYIDWLAGLNNLRQPLDDYVQAMAEEYSDDIFKALDKQDSEEEEDDRGRYGDTPWDD